MQSQRLILDVKEDPETKDLFIEFPDNFMDELGWKVGDTIEWTDRKDGSWLLTKKGDASEVQTDSN